MIKIININIKKLPLERLRSVAVAPNVLYNLVFDLIDDDNNDDDDKNLLDNDNDSIIAIDNENNNKPDLDILQL
jgi:hypothetical protein